jgi:hypothetical protein
MNTSCGKEWSRKFLISAFSKSFIAGDWKKHRAKVLLDKETALLPATQAIVETEIQKEKIDSQIYELDAQIRKINATRRDLLHVRNGVGAVNVRNKSHFHRACPDGDCRGYLSSAWKCGLCEKHACKDCHAVIGLDREVEHTCDPDELATAKLLDKDTKPCPKCSTGIFKIEGCDQMWCTQCHTAFSWKSGSIETHIHNPHFFEWQRKTGGGIVPRAPGDILCGREINHNFMTHEISPTLKQIFRIRPSETFAKGTDGFDMYNDISNIIRSVLHLRQVDMEKYRVDNVENHLKLRVMYMRNKIDKDTFQSRIQRDNKKYEKKKEMFEILQMFIQTMTDILYRFSDSIKNLKLVYKLSDNIRQLKIDALRTEYDGMIREVAGIVEYVNDFLLEISNTYGCQRYEVRPYGKLVLNNGKELCNRKTIDAGTHYIYGVDVLCPVETTKTKKVEIPTVEIPMVETPILVA